MKIKETPQIIIRQSGKSVKVLQVTGKEGMSIPEHFCTKEAVLVVQEGTAILTMNGKETALTRDQSFIIPGGKKHALNMKEEFQAVVIMDIDSEIKFHNQ